MLTSLGKDNFLHQIPGWLATGKFRNANLYRGLKYKFPVDNTTLHNQKKKHLRLIVVYYERHQHDSNNFDRQLSDIKRIIFLRLKIWINPVNPQHG